MPIHGCFTLLTRVGLALGMRSIKYQIVISPNPLIYLTDISVSKTDKNSCPRVSYILVLVKEI